MRPTASCIAPVLLALLLVVGVARPARAAPEGIMTWAVHITLASRWLDPAETEGIITPFMVLYALHDALVKPMPAGLNTPSLAGSFTQSKDGLSYEFVIRKGVKFHDGERAAMTTAWREKKLKNVIVGITGAGGNAATRLDAYVSKNGIYTAGVLPEVEDLFQGQARETDPKRREALIHQIQQILHDRVTHIPIYELAFIWGVGPTVEEPGINLIRSFAYSGPLEDLRLKKR